MIGTLSNAATRSTKIQFLNKKAFEGSYFPRYENAQDSSIITTPCRIFAISHLWETRIEPDPFGIQFSYCKELLLQQMTDTDGLFYDYSSIYQGDLGDDGKRSFPKTHEGKQLKNEFNKSLDLITNIFSGNLSIQLGEDESTKIEVQSIVVSLHFHPQSMTRGWPYFELYKASQGNVSILGQPLSTIAPRVVVIKNKFHKLSFPFSLEYLKSLKNDFPLSIPHFSSSLESLINCRENILKEYSPKLGPNGLRESKLIISWAPTELVSRLQASCGYFANFPDEIFEMDDTADSIRFVYSKCCENSVFLHEHEKSLVEQLIRIVEENLSYLATVDLCYCTFTNGTDADRVKQLASTNQIRVLKI